MALDPHVRSTWTKTTRPGRSHSLPRPHPSITHALAMFMSPSPASYGRLWPFPPPPWRAKDSPSFALPSCRADLLLLSSLALTQPNPQLGFRVALRSSASSSLSWACAQRRAPPRRCLDWAEVAQRGGLPGLQHDGVVVCNSGEYSTPPSLPSTLSL